MAGFRRGAVSMAGRSIKPTSKIRVLLGQSLELAFNEALTAVKSQVKVIRLSMQAGGTEDQLRAGLELLQDEHRELIDVLDEVKGFSDQEDFEVYRGEFLEVADTCMRLEEDVKEYCSPGTDPPPLSDKKEHLAAVLEQTRSLQKEIALIEQRLSQDFSITSTRKPPTGAGNFNSTPVKGKESQGISAGLNQSAAPSTIQQVVSDTRRLDTPNVDPTADALQRLAAVLENRQSKDRETSSRLPKVEPEVFKGDLVSFPGWWNAFETMIESRARTEAEKLFYLSKYTSGPAHECIKGFLSLYGDDSSYKKARNVIVSRFGNRLRIAEAFKVQLNKWQTVKDNDDVGLQRYSDFLWQCHSAMDSLDYLTNLNCREENIKMAVKLPRQVGERWDRIVDEAVFGEEEEDLTADSKGLVGRFPTFQEFCRFVSKEARILAGACTRAPVASQGTSKRAGALATRANESKKETKHSSAGTDSPCDYCKGPHPLYLCKDFLGKNVEFKKEYAVARRLCFGCLRGNHMFRDCRIRNPEIMRDHAQPAKATTMHVDDERSGITAMVIPVWCYFDENPEFRTLVYALLDTQSSACFMSQDLADTLQLEPEKVSLELTTLGTKQFIRCGAMDGLRVKGERADESIALPRCYTRDEIPGNRAYLPTPYLASKWPHLREVSGLLSEPCDEIPFGLLIGFNCSEAFCLEDFRRGERHQPFAWKTVLGWTVSGQLDRVPNSVPPCWNFDTAVKEVNVEEIRRVFDSEFATSDATDKKISQDDVKFDEILTKGLTLQEDGHYQVPLPFRHTPTELPDSKPMAYQRLMSVKKKMQRDNQFKSQYAEFMNTVVSSGQAQIVQAPDKVPTGGRWYWAHHGVKHPRKPGRLRGVWDGRARVHGVCINDFLLTGPDQMNNLVGVLARFRKERVAITCDIEGMFLQVNVQPEHRRYLRFLWFDGGDPDAAVLEYELTVLPFGAASSPGCAVRALNETASRFEGKFGEEAARFVRDHFYVDDGLGSVADDRRALQLMKNSRGLCASGGFNLRKFASSSRAVMSQIPEEWRVESLRELNITQDNMPNESVLGLLMSLEKDAFLYSVQMLAKPDTRRGYLSALSSLFDPMGLVSPALLRGRLLLQRLCARKFDWDEPVEEETRDAWDSWYRQLIALNRLEISRCFRRDVVHPVTRTELHVFSDASDYGYGACCYLLLGDASGAIDTSLVFAKSKVGPTKATTIPRRELQAAVLGVKIGKFIAEELAYDSLQTHFWSDSTVVLGYIANETRRFHVYVANRTQFIRTHTRADQWHHVTTDLNPADVASRGSEAEALCKDELWWKGPVELMQRGAAAAAEELDESDPEIRLATALSGLTQEEPSSRGLWIVHQFSRWSKCVAVAAQCLRFVERIRRRARRETGASGLLVSYQAGAAEWLVSSAQKHEYRSEIDLLRACEKRGTRDRSVLKQCSSLHRLDVYLDPNGVMRVGGRLRLSGWPRRMIHPMVLPGKSELAVRLIEHFHAQTQHQGAVTTLNALRQGGFWLTGGRAVVSGHVLKCVVCRRKRGSVVQQKMADLPPDRLSVEPPFTYVAADLFGPLMIKRGRAYEKWWICIFVCMASRAIHLEPVNSLDTSGFIQAYRRFVARRGPVRSLRCDRGTNFTGAANEQVNAMRELDAGELGTELKRRGCDLIPFEFNYPKASHMAGSWERMIRTVRSAFWVTLHQNQTRLSLEVFQTMIAEAEWLVNSRPITIVDMKDDTMPCALTPAQLLTLKPGVLAPPPGQFGPDDQYSRKRWRVTQYMVGQFWRRWITEYALAQQERGRWQKPREDLRVDDIVSVVDENAPRGEWTLGRVIATAPSRDGLVRKVTVKTSSSELKRPVQKLIFIYRETKSDE